MRSGIALRAEWNLEAGDGWGGDIAPVRTVRWQFQDSRRGMNYDRLAVVTGANSGVGFETTLRLVRAGWEVVMVCRSEARASAAAEAIRADHPRAEIGLELCDLSSLSQVRDLAGRLAERLDAGSRTLGALVNNAGLYRARRETTAEGFEMTLAVNHLSHFLLTRLLERRIRDAGARVINVSSGAHRAGRLDRRPIPEILRGEGRYNGWQAYADSKVANVLFARELHRRWGGDGVSAFSVHPGVLSTNIWDRNRAFPMLVTRFLRLFMQSPAVGGEAVARLVLDDAVAERSGGYFHKLRARDPIPLGRDARLAEALWTASEEAAGLG